MTPDQQWTADMDAWGLDAQQRSQYLWRLHDLHMRMLHRSVRRLELTKQVEVYLGLALLLSLIVTGLLYLVGAL